MHISLQCCCFDMFSQSYKAVVVQLYFSQLLILFFASLSSFLSESVGILFSSSFSALLSFSLFFTSSYPFPLLLSPDTQRTCVLVCWSHSHFQYLNTHSNTESRVFKAQLPPLTKQIDIYFLSIGLSVFQLLQRAAHLLQVAEHYKSLNCWIRDIDYRKVNQNLLSLLIWMTYEGIGVMLINSSRLVTFNLKCICRWHYACLC